MALTRIEKAVSIPSVQVPSFFSHAVTPNKPAAPDISTMTAEDQQRFLLWSAQRENGSLMGGEHKNVSPALKSAMDTFEAYLISPAYGAWATVDVASREMQWRLLMVDVGEAVNAKSTIAPSQDALGVGSAAPLVSEIGVLGVNERQLIPEPVTTGGESPELVFGDDGDIVTNV